MASAEAERFHDRLRRWSAEAAADMSTDGFRACSKSMFDDLGVAMDVQLSPVNAPDVRGVWADVPGDPVYRNVLLFFHGGAFMAGSAETHARFAVAFGRLIGARALLADYRLMPDYRYPTQINDSADVYAWLIAGGNDPRNIVFAGESAGGNLCFTAQLEALRRGLPAPAATYSMSPFLDFEALGVSYVDNAESDLVSAAEMSRYMGRTYLGEAIELASVCPIRANLQGMSPCFVQVGGAEVLVSDSEQMVDALRAAGVEAELDVVPEMQHMYQFEAGVMPEATASYARAAAFVRRFLSA